MTGSRVTAAQRTPSTRHSVKGAGRRIGQRGVNSWRAGSPPRDSRSQIVRCQPVARAEGARSLPEGPGAAAGLDRTYVGSVERGERNVSIDNVERLAEALGIELADLFKRIRP